MSLNDNSIQQLWRKADAHTTDAANSFIRHPDPNDRLACIEHVKKLRDSLQRANCAVLEIERRLILNP